MLLSKKTFDLRRRAVLKYLGILACAATLATGATSTPASAINIGATRSLATQASVDQSDRDVIQERAVARGGGVARDGAAALLRIAAGPWCVLLWRALP